MNWGHKILIVFILFAAGLFTLVGKSLGTRIDMVTPDYYAEELQYQQNIDAQLNAARLSAPVTITQTGGQVVINFPREFDSAALNGQAHFYRPSDSRADLTLPLARDTKGRFSVPGSRLRKGSYHLKLQWEHKGVPYYQDIQFFVP